MYILKKKKREEEEVPLFHSIFLVPPSFLIRSLDCLVQFWGGGLEWMRFNSGLSKLRSFLETAAAGVLLLLLLLLLPLRLLLLLLSQLLIVQQPE